MKLVFLGKFRDLAPQDIAAEVPPDVATLGDLQAWLSHCCPALGEAMAGTRTQIVLNQAIVRDQSLRISADDEIAFLPPMSGG